MGGAFFVLEFPSCHFFSWKASSSSYYSTMGLLALLLLMLLLLLPSYYFYLTIVSPCLPLRLPFLFFSFWMNENECISHCFGYYTHSDLIFFRFFLDLLISLIFFSVSFPFSISFSTHFILVSFFSHNSFHFFLRTLVAISVLIYLRRNQIGHPFC